MNGHQMPHRPKVRSSSPLARRRHLWSTVLLILLLLVPALIGSLLVAGCGSDKSAVEEAVTSTTAAPTTTIADSVDTTAAPTDTTATTTTGPSKGTFPVTVTDDNGTSVTVSVEPMRIVSTAPANTETLFALGVGERVVGVTSLDDYPPEVASITKIGDYTANTEAIMALNPDLVLGYSGNEEALAPIEAAGTPVLILNPTDLQGIYANITTIGAVTGATGAASELVEQLKALIAEITETAKAAGESPTVFYALDNTLWTCGPGSFVDELLALAHATNVAATGPDGSAAQAYYQFTPRRWWRVSRRVHRQYHGAPGGTSVPLCGLKAVKQVTFT